ncbi:hypothetical protein [Melaminivora sp.]
MATHSTARRAARATTPAPQQLPLLMDAPTPPAPGSLLALKPAGDDPLSPAQKKFNRLLARTHTLERQTEELQQHADRLRGPHLVRVDALHQEIDGIQVRMCLLLQQQLEQTRLTPPQQRMARKLLRALVPNLTPPPELQAPWAALASAYAPAGDGADGREQVQQLLEQLRMMAGDDFELPGLDDIETPEQLLQALQREEQRRSEQAQARRARRKPTAQQQAQQQREQDAKAVQRSIYRQLASSLHPDREPDPQERERKQALMSQANAAHERGDLLALLRLQLQIEQIDHASLERMGQERLNALSLLLQNQVGMLERELNDRRMALECELDLRIDLRRIGPSLQGQLDEQWQALQEQAASFAHDLEQAQTEAGLKRWLNQQIHLEREDRRNSMPW